MSIKTEQQAFEHFRGSACPGSRSFLAGSYRRKTQAVHLKDLDIIVVLNDPTGELRASASGTLQLMKRAAFAYPPVTVAQTKCRAVECELDSYTFWADLVPALDDGEGGLVLTYVDGVEGIDEWRAADPRARPGPATTRTTRPTARTCR